MDDKKVKPVTKNGEVVSLPEIPWNDTGKEILKKGTRHSVGNEPGPEVDIDILMEILNNNLMRRRRREEGVNITPRRDRLRGLFGGDKE